MVAGLINIVSYATSDLYLTGAPEITFHKMLYRRHTNFAMEGVIQHFDTQIDFNCESELVPERVGDLIHKCCLRIRLPRLNITKEDVGINLNDEDTLLRRGYADQGIVTDYNNMKNVYSLILTDIYRIIYRATNAQNVSYTSLVQDVMNYATTSIQQTLTEYDEMLNRTRQRLSLRNLGVFVNVNNSVVCNPDLNILDPNVTNLFRIISNLNANTLFGLAAAKIDTEVVDPNSREYTDQVNKLMKDTVLSIIDNALENIIKVQDLLFTEFKKFNKQIEYDNCNNIRFAWVERLGHSIIEYMDVFIGGRRIDRHYGMWMDIWYQLTRTQSQERMFKRMIGDVKDLTNFDTRVKPEYELYIPLTYWFNKFNGLSFPLIAMQYNDIRFKLKLRKFEDVAYIEKIFKVTIDGIEYRMTENILDFVINRSVDRGEINVSSVEEITDICLSDIFENNGKSINGDMIVDYVYLHSDERLKFAQSGHEYLIERVQDEIFDNLDRLELTSRLDFVNPSKEVIWAFHKNVYGNNSNGYYKSRWTDFTANGDQPMIDMRMQFNSYVRIEPQEVEYYNYLQPFYHHRLAPNDGVYLYSFGLDPLQHQPTGECNFSKLSDVILEFNINPDLYRYTIQELYPEDVSQLDYVLTINDPVEFANTIDIDRIRRELIDFDVLESEGFQLTSEQLFNKDILERSVVIYDTFLTGDVNTVEKSLYVNIPLTNTASLFVFSLSLNILRIIGGYGSIAYSGNH